MMVDGGVEGVMMIYTEWLGVRVRKCWLMMRVDGVMGGVMMSDEK